MPTYTKKLNRDDLLPYQPTAQVRMLCCEILSDGAVHTRKEVLEYVQRKRKEFNLEPFREGHTSGGFTEAVTNMNCKKIGTGIYQAELKNNDITEISMNEKALDICEYCINQLSILSREIDYINADEREITFLNSLKDCVSDIKKWQCIFQNK